MRPLTPTLLAAQRSLGGVPSVQVRVEDRELRWAPLVDDDSSTCLTAACPASGGIVRARIGAGGTLDVQRITSPATAGQWQAWTTLASGVATASDLAISPVDGDPSRVRLFFVRTGGSPYRLSWVQSADAGQTWSEPADFLSGLAAADRGLASANAQLLYHDQGDNLLKLALRGGWDAGAWAVRPWAASGALAIRYGLAAGFAQGVYRVASCDQECPGIARLRTGAYDVAADAWSGPVAVVPPGLPAASFVPKYPSLERAAGLWQLACLETFSGLLTYSVPAVIHSADWEHWSYACQVPLEAFGPKKRAALVRGEQTLYLAMECAVWQAPLYNPDDPDRCLETGDVVAYLVEEEPWAGHALVEIYNPHGRYDRCGQAGQAGAPARPLATLVLERGYRTGAGEERVSRPPYYIVNAALRRGGPRPTLRLEAEDGWGLLRRWQPDGLYAWAGKSIRWLVAEILYRAAGLACTFDGASGWDAVLDSFAVAPGSWEEAAGKQRRAWLSREMRAAERGPSALAAVHGSGLGAVRTLLAKLSAGARWQPDGSLYCFAPWAQALVEPYAIGAGGEILDALYGQGLILPGEARVFGDGVAAAAAGPAAQGLSRRYVATCVDPHLTTAKECADRASGLAAEGQARACLGWVETPCQCGLDLFDLVTLADPHAGALQSACLRVAGVVERYEPAAGAFTTRATFEGV